MLPRVDPKRVVRATISLATFSFLAVVGGACGPSFQAIYEGNARFEHCYALEENPQTGMHEKAACWRDWSEHYTFGQTRDRIHYATARYVALQAIEVPTDEAMMMAAPGMTPRQSTITAPNPTNAFAPPPKVLEDYDASTGKPARPSERPVVVGAGPPSVDAGVGGALAAVPLPAGDCTDPCGKGYRECREPCSAQDAGAARAATCAGCEKIYRACMRACIK
jgi:hypothetical protein